MKEVATGLETNSYLSPNVGVHLFFCSTSLIMVYSSWHNISMFIFPNVYTRGVLAKQENDAGYLGKLVLIDLISYIVYLSR